jgi:hypothetical protein
MSSTEKSSLGREPTAGGRSASGDIPPIRRRMALAPRPAGAVRSRGRATLS